MTRKRRCVYSLAVVAVAVLLVVAGCRKGKPETSQHVGAWAQVPDILAHVTPPVFPDVDFNVQDFNAVSDGQTDCREAIMAAVLACSEAEGGRVLVPAGTYLVKGPIHLESNVNLHLAEGAHLKFGGKYIDYLPLVMTRWEGTRVYNYSPFVFAYRKHNVALTGKGTLDGQAKETWSTWTEKDDAGVEMTRRMNLEGNSVVDRFLGDGHFLRPSMIQFLGCENVLVEGVKIVDSPFWCLHPVFSKNVTIRGVRFDSHNPNNDGIDLDSCEYVHVHDVVFNNGDDCIAIKSGRGPEGREMSQPSRNIYIHDCTFNAYTAIAIGSEMSGSVYNVFAENCAAKSQLKRAFRIKGNRTRGGEVAHIRYRNMTFLDAREEMIDFVTDAGGTLEAAPRDFPPFYHDVRYENITAAGPCTIGLNMRGQPDMPIRNVVLRDVTVVDAQTAKNIVHTTGLVTQNVTLVGEVQEPNSVNLPPDVYAGADVQLEATGGTAELSGSVHDDGAPTAELTYAWSVIQGDAAAVKIANPAALQTQATFSQEGIFILKLEVSDGQASGYHFMMVKVGEQPKGMTGVTKPIFASGQ